MTNGEKFKTAEERAKEFETHCNSQKSGCNKCILNKYAGDMCRFAWLDLEYKKPPRKIEEIIADLREISTAPIPNSFLDYDSFITIRGKVIQSYFSDIANEIEAAWNRRV